MVDSDSKELSVRKQCDLLKLSRGALYYKAVPEISDQIRDIADQLEANFMKYPMYGYRKHYHLLQDQGLSVSMGKALKLMRYLGIQMIFIGKKKTSIAAKGHKVYPYLLKDLVIDRSNKVWSLDITYIRVKKGFCYFVGVIDWYSRRILSYRISNSLEAGFCIEALKEAFNTFGIPEIVNTDQGNQFTSEEFSNLVIGSGSRLSMDGKGRWLDNVVIERFFRTLKYENIFLNGYDYLKELKEKVKIFIEFYNDERLHQSLSYKTPSEVYREGLFSLGQWQNPMLSTEHGVVYKN